MKIDYLNRFEIVTGLRKEDIYAYYTDFSIYNRDHNISKIESFGEYSSRRAESHYYVNKKKRNLILTSYSENDRHFYYRDEFCSAALRPVIKFSSSEWNKEWNNQDIIQYGSYPKSLVQGEYEEKLNNLFQNDGLLSTGNSYHVLNYSSTKIAKEYYYDGCRFVFFDFKWFKVEPINWIRMKNNLVCLDLCNSEIGYSYIDLYLKYFSKEAFQTFDYELIKNNENANSKTSELENLISKIYSLLPSYHGKLDVEFMLEKALKEYNLKIKNNDSNEIKLSLEDNNNTSLYLKLQFELNDLLKEIYSSNEKTESYSKMLDLLNRCDISYDDELSKEIHYLKTKVLSLLDESDKPIIDKLDELIDNEKELVNGEIKQIIEGKLYPRTFEELKNSFRRKYFLYLNYLYNYSVKKDVLKEVKEKIDLLVYSEYDDGYKNIILFYVKKIEEVKTDIRSRGNTSDIIRLDKILATTLLDGNSYDEVVNNLVKKIIELNKIVVEIDMRIENGNYIIDFDRIKNKVKTF